MNIRLRILNFLFPDLLEFVDRMEKLHSVTGPNHIKYKMVFMEDRNNG